MVKLQEANVQSLLFLHNAFHKILHHYTGQKEQGITF